MPFKWSVAPRKTVVRGKLRWAVTVPRDVYGVRRRLFFVTKAAAEECAADLERRRRSGNAALLTLSSADQVIMAEQLKRLGGSVPSLVDAVTLYLSRQSENIQPVSLPKAIAEFIDSREQAGMRHRYLATLRHSLNAFARAYRNRQVSEVSREEIETYLNGWAWGARTRRGHLVNLQTFFNWSVKRGYCVKTPVDGIEKPRSDDATPGIFSVDECRRLLPAVREKQKDLLPYVVLGLFCGIRPAEVFRLKWENIKMDSGFVEVPGPSAKSRRRRLVTISENARAWLRLGGKLPPLTSWQARLTVARRAAGLTRWPHDCLRHSFASYHLAEHQSPDKTAHELGHYNTEMLFQHYRELVTRQAAGEFWALKPV